jgi:hypothetical protein
VPSGGIEGVAAARSIGSLHALVDFITKRYKVDGLGQKRLSAVLWCLAFGLCIAVGGVIMMIGTSGRAALALGHNSNPLIPGMLMSERIKMSDILAASLMRWRAAEPDWANSMMNRPT